MILLGIEVIDGGPDAGMYVSRGYDALYPDGRRVYKFSKETGHLQLSLSVKDLGTLIDHLGDLPEEGIDLTLPINPHGNEYTIKGVKQITYLEQKGSPILNLAGNLLTYSVED